MRPWSHSLTARARRTLREMRRDTPATRHARESRIAARLASGALRRDEPVRTRFAKGRDGECAACEAVIETTQFTSETAFADQTTLCFHQDCYHAWHEARASERRGDV